HVGLEGDLDLVAPHLLDDADPECRVLNELFPGEAFLRRVLARVGGVLLRHQRLPARDLRLLADCARLPLSLLVGRRFLEGVLALTGVATDTRRFRAHHREDGVAEHHLAFGAKGVDVTADSQGLWHGPLTVATMRRNATAVRLLS